MTIRAEFYSRLREIVGTGVLEVALAEGASVNDLWTKLCARHPQLRDFDASVLFGVGVEFVDRKHVLRDGDAVAIMPPVQGG